MGKTIRLVGGPADGRSLEWRGGDESRTTLDFPLVSTVRVDFGDQVRFETALYVRSRKTPNLFIYQP